MALRPFSGGEGTRLLTEVLGAPRVRADQDAADELVELCDGLPLALRAAVSELELRPHWPISHQVGRMRGRGAHPPPELRASLWRSYRVLSAPAQAAFRLVAALDRPVSALLAATALGTDELAAESLLEDLAQCHLVEVDAPADSGDPGGFRYRVLRPVRGAARLITGGEERPPVRVAGEIRVAHAAGAG